MHRREAGARGRAPPPPYVLALLLDTDEEARYAAYGLLQSLVDTAWGRALVVRGVRGRMRIWGWARADRARLGAGGEREPRSRRPASWTTC